jgi:hypothetical protein
MMDSRHADGIGEPEQRREIVADVPPGVMRAMGKSDRARTVFALLPLDLVGDELDRLGPRNPHIS